MPIQLLIDTPEIGLVTTNMDRMREFYEQVLGLEYQHPMDFAGGTMHRYQFGSSVLKLVEYDTPPPEPVIPGNAMITTGYRYCTLVVSNLQEAFKEIAAAGYQCSEITAFGEGIGFGFIQDPDGNNIELAGPIS